MGEEKDDEKKAELVSIERLVGSYISEEIALDLRERGFPHFLSFGRVITGGTRVLGKGKTGVVVLTPDLMALKIRRKDSPKETMEIEAHYQRLAGDVAPRLFDWNRNFILMEYVQGRMLSQGETLGVIIDLLKRAKSLDERMVFHKELVRPWRNVIVGDSRTYIIDFDSATLNPSKSNVSILVNFFTRDYTLSQLYLRKKLTFDELVTRVTEIYNERQGKGFP